MRHVCIWPGRPAIASRIIDVGACVRNGRRSHRSCNTLLPRGRSTNIRVASSDQKFLRANASRSRPVYWNRHRCDCGPGIGHNVILVMIRRCKATVPVTSQICELAYDAVAGATHRYGNGRPRSVPGIGNWIILPSLALLAEGESIKPTHNIDFAIARIIHCGREITTSSIRHGCTHCPGVRCNIVDLRDIQNIEVRVESAKDIYLVRVGRVSHPSVVFGNWQGRQRGPRVSN